MTRLLVLTCSLSLSLLTALPSVPLKMLFGSRIRRSLPTLTTMRCTRSAIGTTPLAVSSLFRCPSLWSNSLLWWAMTNQQLEDAYRLLASRGIVRPEVVYVLPDHLSFLDYLESLSPSVPDVEK